MKDVFLVHITLPDFFSEKFYDLIDLQRKHINNLLDSGTVLSYSMDMERNNLWVQIQAISEQQVMDILSSFPIIKEVKVNIHELAFLNIAPAALPELSLN